jgi:hypothetical protein
LRTYRDASERRGQVYTLTYLRRIRLTAGDYPAARDLREALDLARQLGSPLDEAHALAGLGRCALAAEVAGVLTELDGL